MEAKISATAPCRYCGVQTPMLGTRLCNWCWELERRILQNTKLASVIFAAVLKKEATNA